MWVRISDKITGDWALNLKMLAAAPPGAVAGVVLAQVESGEQVTQTAALLPHGTPVVALIETAVGLVNVTAIARSTGDAAVGVR